MIQGWCVGLGDMRPSRRVPVGDCPHPADDHQATVFGRYHAIRCGWCGGISLGEPR